MTRRGKEKRKNLPFDHHSGKKKKTSLSQILVKELCQRLVERWLSDVILFSKDVSDQILKTTNNH